MGIMGIMGKIGSGMEEGIWGGGQGFMHAKVSQVCRIKAKRLQGELGDEQVKIRNLPLLSPFCLRL